MGLAAPIDSDPVAAVLNGEAEPKNVQEPRDSQTASDYIDTQLQLEADAREALPYSFDSCTYSLGPLRQTVFACLTCSPPPASAAQVYTPAGVCYSCSISCHAEHTLVELFSRRNFVCDCGTTRLSSTALCTLRADPVTGSKGVHSQEPAKGNHYNHNFQNHFCGCGEEYDAEKEKGTMFQCLGLGTVETGGCGEDWWHPQCLMGLSKDWQAQEASKPIHSREEPVRANSAEEDHQHEDDDTQTPLGFPHEDDFESMICYKCVESNPWIRQYAGTAGFLPAVFKRSAAPSPEVEPIDGASATEEAPRIDDTNSRKRKASDDETETRTSSSLKRFKNEAAAAVLPDAIPSNSDTASRLVQHKHESLPPAPSGPFNLFLKEEFRDHLCHCPSCFPNLLPHPQLLDDEETYEPPLSESGGSEAGGGPPGSGAARSQGTGSLLERGEAALSGVDRVRAIEGVMVYNNLKEKVKAFLKPYAESGQPVGAEDIKAYFEKLRGDDQAILDASEGAAGAAGRKKSDDENGGDGGAGPSRTEQSGY